MKVFAIIFFVLIGCTSKPDAAKEFESKTRYYDSLHALAKARAEVDNNNFDSAAKLNDRASALRFHDAYLLHSEEARRLNDSVLFYMDQAARSKK